MAAPHVSICIATHNKPVLLSRALASIRRQVVPFAYEIVVIDDGSAGDETRRVCGSFGVDQFDRIEREGQYRNPAKARNLSYLLARASILILQSDDVVHESPDAIEQLARIQPGTFNIATVHDSAFSDDGQPVGSRRCYTGVSNERPLFFLGSILREHVYAVGGNDEDFTEPGYEDDWFGDCLIHGLGLQPHYRSDVLGLHQRHPRPPLRHSYRRMSAVWSDKVFLAEHGEGPWTARTGAWPKPNPTD